MKLEVMNNETLIDVVKELTEENAKLEAENKILENKLFELAMTLAVEKHNYSCKMLLEDEDVFELQHIMVNGYNSSAFIDEINKYGYERVNQWFMKKISENKEGAENA